MNGQYIIKKASRWINGETATVHEGYRGHTCERAGIEPGKVYTDLDAAKTDADLLSDYNGVGWRVWEVGQSEPCYEVYNARNAGKSPQPYHK